MEHNYKDILDTLEWTLKTDMDRWAAKKIRMKAEAEADTRRRGISLAIAKRILMNRKGL